MREFGVSTKDASGHVKDQNEIMKELSAKLSGQASAASDTFTGHIDALKAHFEDLAAKLGAKYGPAITAVGTAMAGVGAAFQAVPAVLGLVSAAWDALTAAEYASMLPYVLIIAGIALVGVAVYELVTHWTTVWNTIKAIVMDVWHWIIDNWPILLGVLLGPIALAAALIYKFFGKDIRQWVSDAIGFITGAWNGLVDFFTGLPGRMAGVFAHMWDSLVDAFRAVLNEIIDLWNALHFKLPKVDVLGVHIGGETIGVPQIPHLAQGGLITSSGLVYAHAGEAVVPAGKMGPAVHIDNATFKDEADLDMLFRQAQFATSAGRM
jgi:phage-related protein